MYRVRVCKTDGMEFMCRLFQDSTEWEGYWTALTDPKALQGYAGNGTLIFSKEYMTPEGIWVSKDRFPVMTGQ